MQSEGHCYGLLKVVHVCCFIWHHQSPKRKQMTLKRGAIQGEIYRTKGRFTVMWVLEDQKGWCINLKRNEAVTTWET